MNSPADSAPGSPADGGAAAPAALSATRPLYWSVRRELWENPSIYMAPLVAAAVLLLGFGLWARHLPDVILKISTLEPDQQHMLLTRPSDIAAILMIVTSMIVAWFYCLDALHSERRDRSILFWKSLPVSDVTTVLSKLGIPMVVLPLVTFVLIVATHLTTLLLGSVTLLAHGMSAAILWTHLPIVQMALVLLYGQVVIALWYAPVYAWLLLVSAWAQRATFLWAVGVPIAVCIVERIGFGTSYFGSMLKSRLGGSFAQAFVVHADATVDALDATGPGASSHRGLSDVFDAVPDPAHFLSSPGLWIGLAVAAVLLAGAISLRRSRAPI
jgi:ABC-2 type transport system permease protein